MSDAKRLREALAQIAEIAGAAANGHGPQEDNYEENGHRHREGYDYGCTLKTLPAELLVPAAMKAVEINPVNAPVIGPVVAVESESNISDIQRISVVTGKYWGPQPRRLSVSFMENTPSDLRARIVSHLNAWSRTAAVTFAETQGVGQVRISRGNGGYWSYLGTDILLIPTSRQTMNLQGFTMNTLDSEFTRVIRHEAGHTLGFPHEHMRRELVARLDPQKTYDYFRRTQGWDPRTVDQQVLTPLNDRTIFGTPADQDSIMCYQLPGAITRDGRPIRGGVNINQTDFDFAGRIYPRGPIPPPRSPFQPRGSAGGERSEAPNVSDNQRAEELNFDVEYA